MEYTPSPPVLDQPSDTGGVPPLPIEPALPPIDATVDPARAVGYVLGVFGPTTVVAIHCDTGRTVSIWLDWDTAGNVTRWIGECNQAGYNIYITVNQPSLGLKKKAKKSNIEFIRAVWADIDCYKNGLTMVSGWAAITAMPAKPTRTIASGGGYHPYYILREPLLATPDIVARVEALGLRIAATVGGDAVQNVDRIMRFPFTLNHPDAKKRAAGRTVCPSGTVGGDEGPRYTLEELETAFSTARVVALPRETRQKNTSLVDNLSGSAPPAIMAQRRAVQSGAAGAPSMNDAAQTDVHWAGKLSPENLNAMLWAFATDPRVVALANQPRDKWRQFVWSFKAFEQLGATEAKEAARKWSQDGASEEHPFTEEGFENVWGSFDPAGGTTAGTLLDAVKKVGFDTQPWRDIANGAAAVVGASPAVALPTIRVINGLRHKAADEGLAAMQAAGVPFYQRGRDLVRICRIPAKTSDGKDIEISGIMPVALPLLERALGKSARWEKCNAKGDWLRIDPPQDVAKQIAAMTGEWNFPSLTGVTGTPTLRPDGSVLDAVGYDPATGLYLFAPPPMPPIPTYPSKADALAALALVDGLLDEFPFVDDASRSVGISMLMTPVLRGAFPVVPLHGVDAPQSGTGKSYLADISSAIATGERCAVIAAAPKQEETEKRLIMAALSGQAIIALDNINGEIGGDFLCQVTERPLMKVRRLCSSDDHLVRNAFTIFCNGNNMTVVADLVRRTLVGRLDANMEWPYDRTFRADPLAAVLADRGRYVAAVLTIARAYIAAGKPALLPALASFKEWSDLVRSALVWLGRADPVSTIATTAAEDPVQQERAAVFSAWASELPLAPAQYMTGELIEKADEKLTNIYPPKYTRPTLRDALGNVAGARNGFGIDAKRLGQWLGRNEGVVCAGCCVGSVGLLTTLPYRNIYI
jgi:hypothetical protein